MATRREVEDTRHTVEGLCRLARELGYDDAMQRLINRDGTCIGDLLYFFEDNPGACEAVIQWVLDEGCHRDGTPLDDEDEDFEEVE